MKRLAIVTTHPIQYYAPVFKLLHKRGRISIKVFYTWGEAALQKYDPGFQKHIQWDVPLLDGYPYEWVLNTAANKGSHHFKGIVTPGLNQQIEDWKPDAVLIFGWAYKGHLSAMRYFKGKLPVFFRGDSTMLDMGPGVRSAIKNVFLRWIYRKVDYAFYVGANNKAYFKTVGLIDSQLIFAPHAVDNARFYISRNQEVLALRDSLSLKPDDILLLFAGKFEAKKNPHLLLESFKKIKKPNLHLLFVGNGELERGLKNAAAIESRIHFMDFMNQSEIPVVYQAADLFCMPSAGPGETWGLAVNEAMAAAKPVLVSNKVGCAVDLVRYNINGEIFKSQSVEALTDALLRLTSDKDSLAQMGAQSKKIIQPWNFISIAEAIEETLIQSYADES
ncbi:glycosyltransferase family 4 protein [Mucilaginibacter panaciglaebae]|uniref:Glycosyl transferase family 1 domain-containing protein n=1 Tax=Mucilaginibacter panaciglaebae TaxID=502331 RepID=A0ABP7WXD3_9SPHI